MESKKKITSYLPWIGLIVLTLGLMILFKLTDQGYDTLKSKGENILAKYTKGLSPLYSKTDLSDEDVFNFALYNKLPIDKENKKVLSLESDSYKNEKLQVLTTESNFDTDNYNSFKEKLRLNEKESDRIDSLLRSYKNDLYATILQSEEDVVAIDPKIAMLHKALSSEIYDFAINRMNSSNDAGSDKQIVSNYAKEFKENHNSEKVGIPKEFIVLTPDTAFSSRRLAEVDFGGDEKLMAEKFKPAKINSDFPNAPVVINDFDEYYEINPIPDEDFHYWTDSSLKKLVIPSAFYNASYNMDFDSLHFNFENLAAELDKINFTFGNTKNGFKFSIKTQDKEKIDEVNIDFDVSNLGSFINNTIQLALESSNENDWEKFGQKMDSLSEVISDIENDSAAIIKLKMLSKELKKKQKESELKSKDPSSNDNN